VNVKVEMPTGTELVEAVRANPVMVLVNPEAFAPFLAGIKREIAEHVPDITTAKGRDAIKSLAFKVTRTKTAIDDAGKKLNEEARAKINLVDGSRRAIREQLEQLAEEVRAPLTAWEEAEKGRVERVDALFAELEGASIIQRDWTSENVAKEIADIEEMDLPPVLFQDRLEEATQTREKVLFTLREAHARIVQEEAGRAELAKLRAEQAAREQERVAREAAEKAARARAEREDAQAAEMLQYIKQVRMGFIGGAPYAFGILLRELEIKIVPAEFADRHQAAIEAARAEAHEHLTQVMERQAEKARLDAEKAEAERIALAEKRAAEAAAWEAQRRADEAVAEERRKAMAEVEKAHQEAERLRRTEEARVAEEKRIADEAAARARDQEHRNEVMGLAATGIVHHGGATLKVAKAIVLAIVAGSIPNVTLRF